MERDYAAIIAAMREKAKRTEFPEEREALEAKAKELEEKYDVRKPTPEYVTNPTDWINQHYRMSPEDFADMFFTPPPPTNHLWYPRNPTGKSTFLINIVGEDPKWRRSYLWPSDGSPQPNPDHSWEDTEFE